MIEDRIKRADILLEALPYIRRFFGKTIVIKYGGSIMVDAELKARFAEDIVLLKYVGVNPIVVHGGGKEISKWMQKLGKESAFIDGLRVTDSETMEITEMVLSGKINNDVVSLINRAGGKAVGLSGKDANLFRAKKIRSKSNQDLGFVGDITDVDVTLLHTLTEKGYIPIVASVGTNDEGDSLNMNADHAAERISIAVEALKLIFLTDVDGLMIDNVLQATLSVSEARDFLSHPDVKTGMVPKLTCAVRALEEGVMSTHIINGTIRHAVLLELFTDTGIGTMMTNRGGV